MVFHSMYPSHFTYSFFSWQTRGFPPTPCCYPCWQWTRCPARSGPVHSFSGLWSCWARRALLVHKYWRALSCWGEQSVPDHPSYEDSPFSLSLPVFGIIHLCDWQSDEYKVVSCFCSLNTSEVEIVSLLVEISLLWISCLYSFLICLLDSITFSYHILDVISLFHFNTVKIRPF